jgi:hypothetical protein
MSGIAAPSAPAAGQGRVFFDQTAKNLSVIADDGAIKYGAQVIAGTESFFLTAFAADGTFSAARPSIASLSDGASVVTLTGAQRVTGKQMVPRPCQLGATSGSLTPNADTCDVVYREDVAGQVDMQDPTATGSNPAPFQTLSFSLKAASADQTVTWTSLYTAAYGSVLPATIPTADKLAISFRYSPVTSKWEQWASSDDNLTVSSLVITGATDGAITIQGQANAGTFNFNLPTTAGSSGQVLTSAGGGASAMTWTSLATGATATSSTVGHVLRVGSGPTIAYGAVDLADSDAVTGVLPNANTTAASANTASAIVARDGSGNFTAGTITAALTGNASTATALASNPTDCGGGQFATAIDASGNLTCGTPAGGGTGSVQLLPRAASLPTSNSALIDASENNTRALFDATIPWCLWWEFSLPPDYASTPVMKIQYSMTSATSGSLNFDVSVMAVTPGDAADANTDSYDTANACDDAAVPGTAGHMEEISCALTNFDSGAARDLIRLKLCRDSAGTATGNAELLRARLEYAR